MTHWTQDPAKVAAAALKRNQTYAQRRQKPEHKEEKQEESKPRGHNATEAVNSRWAAERANEQEVNQLFVEIAIDEGLQLLAKMRANAETAARTLNDRMSADDKASECVTCGGGKKPGKQWALIRPERDKATGMVRNFYFCCVACIALENQRKQGTYGVPDRGMLQSDNERPKPVTA